MWFKSAAAALAVAKAAVVIELLLLNVMNGELESGNDMLLSQRLNLVK